MIPRSLRLLAATGLLSGLAALTPASAQTDSAPAPAAAPAAADPTADLKALVASIKTKLQAGQESPADLAPEIATFDQLLKKYADNKSEAVAEILFMKATLYLEIFEDSATARTLLEQVKTDFPGTDAIAAADKALASIDRQAQAEAVKAALIGKPAPAINFTWSTRDGLKSLADLKGKVVILDFWATWCGPCIRSFPHVREIAAHYADSAVAVVGVTSIQGQVSNLEAKPIDTSGDPAKELSLLPAFIKKHDMTWTVAVSEQEVFNPDYGVMGIPYLCIIAPDGTVRKTGLHPGAPVSETTATIDAILAEFKLPVPAATGA